ncbi:hypothetical protein Q664_50920 [Archangium violaceum Cb vi76]|uniref:DUF7948 domain-containing protein n=1 Tax=Archangium violaceum Cb vi76 TaxID=1406225 RepID=A0A084SEU9_9BACT|nr:hypothetical protein Q664_50920 [Archangium violaceum Cb vi76]
MDKPANLMAPVFRPGIAPAPKGSAGKFELRHLRSRALFTDRGVELSLPSRTQQSRTLGWSVAGGRAVSPQAEKPREAKLHRLTGPRKSWEREVPTYEGLRYPGVLPGVDLWFEERAEGVEYGFRAERGADLRRVTLEYAGAREVRVVEQGRALEVDLGEGVLREQGLHCAQEWADGMLKPVGCRFTDARPVGPERWAYAIEVDVEDPERPVVVDPLVLWNTYFGGPGYADAVEAIQQNNVGHTFIVGTLGGSPVLPPPGGQPIGHLGGQSDVLIARFQADGGIVWWTLLGDSGEDLASELLIGESGELYVAGLTTSPAIEWTLSDGGTAVSRHDGGGGPDDFSDGFVARLDSSGKKLDWFRRVDWGGDDDEISDLIRGPDGRLLVSGQTANRVPLEDGGSTVDQYDALISRIDPLQGTMDWTLRLKGPRDGSADETITRLAPRDDSSVYAVGSYSDLPGAVTNAIVTLVSGVNGSSPEEGPRVIMAGDRNEYGIALTPLDGGVADGGVGTQVLVWGYTTSTNFPEFGAVKGESDIFVSVVRDDGSRLELGNTTLLGGSKKDELRTVTTDSAGRVYLGGLTDSPDLNADGGFDTSLNMDSFNHDGFVARVRLEPKPEIEWASYVGGNGKDEVFALQVDNQNPDRLFIGGSTTSSDLQYSDAGFDPTVNGVGADAYSMFLFAVDTSATPTGPGPGPGSGEDPDEQQDPLSALGWSCGASVTSGGPGALALGVLAGLALLVSRRRPRA